MYDKNNTVALVCVCASVYKVDVSTTIRFSIAQETPKEPNWECIYCIVSTLTTVNSIYVTMNRFSRKTVHYFLSFRDNSLNQAKMFHSM